MTYGTLVDGQAGGAAAGSFEEQEAEEIEMGAQNCWEFKACGREPGGAHTGEFGVCPAVVEVSCDGLNSGENAGRICWAIAGTFCGGKVQGEYASKRLSCMTCDFFKKVEAEEGSMEFVTLPPGQCYIP